MLCCAKAILYPGLQIVIASANISQAKIIIDKIIKLKDDYPMIAQCILKINYQKDYGKITFRGGSVIETVVSGEGARGHRAHMLVLDESRLMFKDDIKNNLEPFLTGNRTPLYLNKHREDYTREYKKEHNTTVYLTSIGYKSEWSYRDLLTNIEYMANGLSNYGAMILPYQFGVEAGIITRDFIEQQLRGSQEDISIFRREMEVIPYGVTEHSLFDYAKLSKCRCIHQALYPLSEKDYILCKGDITQSKYYIEKQPGELRILTFDIAYAMGRKNDNSAISVIRIFEDGDHYVKSISFMEILNGISIDEQALRVKQIFYDLECDYAVVDPGGSGGIAMVQILGQKTLDAIRGVRYPGWRTYDGDKKFDEYVQDSNAEPVMYCMASSAANIHYTLKTIMDSELNKGNVLLLLSEKDIIDELNQRYEYLRLSTGSYTERAESMSIIQSYANTSSMIDEAINAKFIKTRSGKYTIDEGAGRKDRIISVLYGIYFIVTFLERDLIGRNTKIDYKDYYTSSKNTPNKDFKNPFQRSMDVLRTRPRR